MATLHCQARNSVERQRLFTRSGVARTQGQRSRTLRSVPIHRVPLEETYTGRRRSRTSEHHFRCIPPAMKGAANRTIPRFLRLVVQLPEGVCRPGDAASVTWLFKPRLQYPEITRLLLTAGCRSCEAVVECLDGIARDGSSSPAALFQIDAEPFTGAGHTMRSRQFLPWNRASPLNMDGLLLNALIQSTVSD